MENQPRPTPAEQKFLSLAYNKFYDIFEIAFDDSFWDKSSKDRFNYIRQSFLIYGEILNYEAIQGYINHLKTARPPMEAEIGENLFKVIRNIIAHFPYFDSWDEVWFNKPIINWYKKGM